MIAPATSDAARRAAVDVVLAVDRDGAYANLLLPRLLRERSISGIDAAFATELAYGSLRYSGVLDAVIAAGAKREVASLDPAVRAVLRLGAYQLLHTRVPPHAAVSSTVDLSREVAGPKPAGLVNAVLRRVAERDWSGWVEQLAPAGDLVGRLAFERGYPRWVATAWLDALGGDPAELDRAMAEQRPATHLVARPGRIARDELLAAAGSEATAGPWSPYAVRLAGGDPAAIAAIRDRRAGVQDEGSQLVALALAAAPVEGRDQRWLDACAGPGGKASLLAGLLPAGGTLLACDVAPHRAGLVRQATGGVSMTTVIVADATRPAWRDGGFDRVLVDAPCTGLGALRRRPEIRWRRQPEDVSRLQQLQHELLGAAIDSTRPGGVVGYATCSPHLAETREVIQSILGARSDIEEIDARPMLPGLPGLGDGPSVQLWPHRHGTDAMFLAIVRRTEPQLG
ncbi:MAG TPA: transcription antitermination factor NusB [Mycobacteriales bacterium]|nr:transcription antitermination factor NusB [Mycobacteriales bacterium]